MSNVTIGDLPAAGGLGGTELIPLLQSAVTKQVTLSALLSYLTPLVNPPGTVIHCARATAPYGYIKANGALLSRVTYAALWAEAQASGNLTASDAAWTVSTTPGAYSPGDGATTFRIPDLRGLTLRNFDDGAGVDTGRTIGSFQDSDNKAHTHSTVYGQATNASSGCLGIPGSDNGGGNCGSTVSASTGGTEARVKSAALLSCLKY